VVRLPARCAVERALVCGLSAEQLRTAGQAVFDAFGPPVELSAVADKDVPKAVIDKLKGKRGLHAPFVAALTPGTPTPPLAAAALDAVRAAATRSHVERLVELTLPGGG
jgi:hypothetical protein